VRNLIRFAVLSSVAISSPVLAESERNSAPATVLQPSGPWRLDQPPNTCDLQRDYAAGERGVTLWISRAAGPGTYDIALVGSGVPKLPGRAKVSVRLDPQGRSQAFEFASMKAPRQPGRLLRGDDIGAALFADLSADQQLTFAPDKGAALSLGLSGAKAAFASMQKCYEDLLRSWSVDPAGVTPPGAGGNPGVVVAQRMDMPRQSVPPDSWVSFNDYPSIALREERGGTVVMALSVNPAGRVESCRVVVSSAYEPLDRRSCEVMIMRAHYTPATGAAGEARAATAIERIRWVIPSGG
jgi:TonB family protein